jgi:hypothetical protein
VGDLTEVGSLNLGVDTGQGAAEGIFGRRVDHLGLQGGVSAAHRRGLEVALTLTGASSGDQVKKQILDLGRYVSGIFITVSSTRW